MLHISMTKKPIGIHLNEWEYHVVTTPKFSEVPPAPEETEVPDEQLPSTGQLNWPIPLLAIGGTLLIGVGLYLSKMKNQEKNSDHSDE